MPDFSIPLSGLTAESTALSAIANNLSNQNTTGYKDTQVQFSDLFYQSLGTTGSGDPIQVGAGTQISGMPSLFTQGSISCHRRAHGRRDSGHRFFCGAELERHHRLHPGRGLFGRCRQLPGHLRGTASAGLSRSQRSSEYRSRDRAPATWRRDHQSADRDRQRAAHRESGCVFWQWAQRFRHRSRFMTRWAPRTP